MSSHIKAASKASMVSQHMLLGSISVKRFLLSVQVVPMGIVLAARVCTVEEAYSVLSQQPNLRAIIEQCKPL